MFLELLEVLYVICFRADVIILGFFSKRLEVISWQGEIWSISGVFLMCYHHFLAFCSIRTCFNKVLAVPPQVAVLYFRSDSKSAKYCGRFWLRLGHSLLWFYKQRKCLRQVSSTAGQRGVCRRTSSRLRSLNVWLLVSIPG